MACGGMSIPRAGYYYGGVGTGAALAATAATLHGPPSASAAADDPRLGSGCSPRPGASPDGRFRWPRYSGARAVPDAARSARIRSATASSAPRRIQDSTVSAGVCRLAACSTTPRRCAIVASVCARALAAPGTSSARSVTADTAGASPDSRSASADPSALGTNHSGSGAGAQVSPTRSAIVRASSRTWSAACVARSNQEYSGKSTV